MLPEKNAPVSALNPSAELRASRTGRKKTRPH